MAVRLASVDAALDQHGFCVPCAVAAFSLALAKISHIFQAPLTCRHARRGLNASYSKHFVPPVNPIMTQQRLRRISSADRGRSFRFGIKVTENSCEVGPIGTNLDNSLWPSE